MVQGKAWGTLWDDHRTKNGTPHSDLVIARRATPDVAIRIPKRASMHAETGKRIATSLRSSQ